MYFQVSNYKGKNFLDLNDDNNNSIHSIYLKGGVWLKHFSLSNLLCACITRFITNYAPIGEYRQRFFPNSLVICLCSNSSIETRLHI